MLTRDRAINKPDAKRGAARTTERSERNGTAANAKVLSQMSNVQKRDKDQWLQ